MTTTRAQVGSLLLAYAWLGDADMQARKVECIMAQDDWRYIDCVADAFDGAQESPGVENGGLGYAISALYDCHGEPHLSSCPEY